MCALDKIFFSIVRILFTMLTVPNCIVVYFAKYIKIQNLKQNHRTKARDFDVTSVGFKPTT